MYGCTKQALLHQECRHVGCPNAHTVVPIQVWFGVPFITIPPESLFQILPQSAEFPGYFGHSATTAVTKYVRPYLFRGAFSTTQRLRRLDVPCIYVLFFRQRSASNANRAGGQPADIYSEITIYLSIMVPSLRHPSHDRVCVVENRLPESYIEKSLQISRYFFITLRKARERE